MKNSSLSFLSQQLLNRALLTCLILLGVSMTSFAAKKYTQASGNWTTASTWVGGVPVAGDTVYILGAHTVTVSGQVYNASPPYMFVIVMGTLDVSNNGKLNFNSSAKVIIETGGRLLGDGNNDQISMGGGPDYKGDAQGNITGPSYVADGHPPTSGEGTAGCGCYSSVGSCTISSTDGYKVHISLTVKKLVKPATCVNGYNYNVQLDYAVSFSGTNIPGGGLWTLQGNITCGSQTLFFDLPNNGGVGTTTTNSNPWRGISDCSTATTTSLGCMSAVTDIEGSGIANGTKCSGTPTTLPVKLISFAGNKIDEGAELTWVTAMERNLNYFEVERAQEDLIFHPIAQIEGQGSLNAETEYTYIDRSASNGKNYYRLKSVDHDGFVEYSDVVIVAFGGTTSGINIYPTIVDQSMFNVEINDDLFHLPAKLSLLNSMGAVVYETVIDSNTSLIQLPSSIKTGVYVTHLSSSSGQQSGGRIIVK